MTDHDRMPAARPSAEDVRRRLATELALPSRLGHTLLLLAGVAVAAAGGSLLAPEPGLPARTRIAFAAIVAAGLAWAAFAAWVLARRRVLFASHRVIAARLAITFSALFTAGAGAVWFAGAGSIGAGVIGAAVVGAAMLVAAIVVLVRARRRVREITARKIEIERLLAGEAR